MNPNGSEKNFGMARIEFLSYTFAKDTYMGEAREESRKEHIRRYCLTRLTFSLFSLINHL